MESKRKSFFSIIGRLLFTIIVIMILLKLYSIYQSHNYNGFTKATTKANITKFTRDKDVKYSNYDSYKMESDQFNDAVFYKEINVTPNTPYRLTCMVKTENVIPEKEISASGVQMCIIDSTESSESYIGTNDWKELEFMFDSKNRDTVKIGFRLGGNTDDVRGTAWFSDFRLEEGIANTDTNWNMGCFIFKNIDVMINNEEIKLSMSDRDITTMESNLERFKSSCKELSGNKMTVKYDTYKIDEPITSISYSEEYGYYVDPINVKETLDKYLAEKEYDHIFVVIRFGNDTRNIEIPVNDWIGLRKYGI